MKQRYNFNDDWGGTVLKGIKTRAVWLAIGLVLGGGALSYAGVAATSSHSPNPHSTVHPKSSEAPEPKGSPEADENDANRPANHGFYVSQAAQCKNVNDTVNNISFTAPADCATNGQAHGQYVSSVARSGIGKGAHGNANNKNKTH